MRHGNNVSKPEQLLRYLKKKTKKKNAKWPLIREVIIVKGNEGTKPKKSRHNLESILENQKKNIYKKKYDSLGQNTINQFPRKKNYAFDDDNETKKKTENYSSIFQKKKKR